MNDIPWSENDELFIKELKEGHEWQFYTALFFKLHGLKVEIPKLTIRENIAEADKWKDSFDIIVEDVPLENKSRNESFTFNGDFPYPTIIVDTVKGFDAKTIRPHGYTMISKPTGIILWLPVSTYPKWTKEKIHDNTRNLDDEFYVCDPKYLQHIDTLLRFLKKKAKK